MTYKEYAQKTRKVKADQLSLDKQFINEYPHHDLFGKVVTVTYRWKGKILQDTAFFEGLQSWFHDVIPVFRVLKNGKVSKIPLGKIYKLSQIIELKEETT